MLSVILTFGTDDRYQDACQSYREHQFFDEFVKAGSGPPILWEFFHQTP